MRRWRSSLSSSFRAGISVFVSTAAQACKLFNHTVSLGSDNGRNILYLGTSTNLLSLQCDIGCKCETRKKKVEVWEKEVKCESEIWFVLFHRAPAARKRIEFNPSISLQYNALIILESALKFNFNSEWAVPLFFMRNAPFRLILFTTICEIG
ncbi:uncharacterized protein LY89DRAFT_456958 [Mollisia scopiformis]|uniref:Uncharacterized protein n=1 Tax=Mollisia scopiformis TaxID=149040 RepID=A0A194XHJ2_MOLSC|nr:uncharacterized protein LY89DRAFT_456958 [Mollisia scopiformis]KUJ19628.1 hypothetical protein LY89DRAFT_456958 [Mollisia scopiformis]